MSVDANVLLIGQATCRAWALEVAPPAAMTSSFTPQGACGDKSAAVLRSTEAQPESDGESVNFEVEVER